MPSSHTTTAGWLVTNAPSHHICADGRVKPRRPRHVLNGGCGSATAEWAELREIGSAAILGLLGHPGHDLPNDEHQGRVIVDAAVVGGPEQRDIFAGYATAGPGRYGQVAETPW